MTARDAPDGPSVRALFDRVYGGAGHPSLLFAPDGRLLASNAAADALAGGAALSGRRNALLTGLALPAGGPSVPKINSNVSAGRSHDADVVSLAEEILHDGTVVSFELSESVVTKQESEAFRYHLDEIRAAGIGIVVDNFGSGNASIIGLMGIAPSALKIDRRIASAAGADARSRHLVSAIVEIAQTLEIVPVAEGVETIRQAETLSGIGCVVQQGFLYGRPMPERDLQSNLETGGRQVA